jgi:alpha-1,6-mannosyltransferase
LALRSYVLSMTIPSMTASYHRQTLFLITYAGVVFRSELAVLVLTISIFIFFINRASLAKTIIPAGIAGLLLGLLTTVPIDSFFWQKWPLWPEWESFYYNTVLGNSSNWGVSPWHYYFANAIPRLLLNPISYMLLIPVAAFQPATQQRSFGLLSPLLAFVALYSLLPHKEWRFILYVIPGLTAVSAMGASWFWQRRSKSPLYRLLNSVLIVSTILSFAISSGILVISRFNYPGGEAIVRLRSIETGERGTIHVYADNLACQTGLTRFLEARDETVNEDGTPQWVFDKTEDPITLLKPDFWSQFDYVITESPERTIGKWQIVSDINSFNGVKILKPGEAHTLPRGLEHTQGSHSLYDSDDHARWGAVLTWWTRFENFMREKVTGGWWVAVRMEPRLSILTRQSTGINTGVDDDAVVEEAQVV